MKKMLPIQNLFLLLFAAVVSLTACNKKGGGSNSGLSEPEKDVVSIQKTQGINVGESAAIWTVGLKPVVAGTLQAIVSRVDLNPQKGYPISRWNIDMTGKLAQTGGFISGSRTFVSEWGLLIGRANIGQTPSTIGLFLVDPATGPTKIFEDTGYDTDARATPFSYKVTKNGVDYKFIAIVSFKSRTTNTFRVERWLRTGNTFVRQRPYEFVAPQMGPGSVYKGFLDPHIPADGSGPRFYGGAAGMSAQVFGIDLRADVPPTPFTTNSTPVTPTQVTPPNAAFRSTSHPPGGVQWGSVNDKVYSFAGDPEEGWLFKSADPDANFSSFVSYDRVNQIVFRAVKDSLMNEDGTKGPTGSERPVVTVFQKSCFIDRPDCSPLNSPAYSKIFTDVGDKAGPTSDLGDGCVAILGWARPTDRQDKCDTSFRAGVYKACIRDKNNLGKGLTLLKLAETEGCPYMYNDFTGANLYDLPVYILFDFQDRGVTSIGSAEFYWIPKVGFGTTSQGLNAWFRCYAKGTTPPATWTPFSLQNAYAPHPIPGCSGDGINMVELRVERNPGQPFVRFESITVSATPK